MPENKRPGIGVMLHMLFGDNKETHAALVAATGKRIASICLDQEQWSENNLVFRFDDGSGIRIYDDGQSCCEHRYMTTDDNLQAFVGTKFVEAAVQAAANRPNEWGEHEVAFLIIMTSLGAFTVETHNEHNGYYGGFWLVARELQIETSGDKEETDGSTTE